MDTKLSFGTQLRVEQPTNNSSLSLPIVRRHDIVPTFPDIPDRCTFRVPVGVLAAPVCRCAGNVDCQHLQCIEECDLQTF